MSTLSTLIKLTDKKLEALQQRIAKLDAQLAAFTARQAALAQEVAHSFKLAEKVNVPDAFHDAHAYRQRAIEEDIRLELLKQQHTQQKTGLLDELRALFAEKKRYEILKDRQLAEKKKTQQKKQQAQLDDLTHSRKN